MRPTKEHGVWFLLAVILLAGLTLYTRGTAPWQDVLTNDEMLHLESWRNRYGTDDIYPIFLRRLHETNMLEGERLEQVEKLYHASPLFQRALLVVIDVHPPTFPLTAEVITFLTDSNLIAQRLVSALASALAVFFAFRLGRDLKDGGLGLWLAALTAIGFLAQVHAGLARPYVLTHFGLIMALSYWVRDETTPDRPPWRFFLACLFLQSTNWPVWAIIFPCVVVTGLRRLRANGFKAVMRETWWYTAGTLAMMPVFAVQLARGVADHHLAERPLDLVWSMYTLGSPFASLDWILAIEPGALLSPAGLLILLLVIAGVAAVFVDHEFFAAAPRTGLALWRVPIALLTAMVVAIVLSIVVARGHVELILILAVVPTVFAAAGVRWLLRTETATRIAVVVTLVAFTVIQVGWPEDPLRRAMLDTDYRDVAEHIEAELGPDDLWVAFRRNRADCLYRYATLPEPVQPLDTRSFGEFLDTLPRADASVFVFARMDVIEQYRILRTAREYREFPNDFRVIRIAARGDAWR